MGEVDFEEMQSSHPVQDMIRFAALTPHEKAMVLVVFDTVAQPGCGDPLTLDTPQRTNNFASWRGWLSFWVKHHHDKNSWQRHSRVARKKYPNGFEPTT